MYNERMPKVGEIVHFFPNPDDTVARSNHNDGPIPAIVTRAWSSVCVNLKIIPDHGPMQDRSSVSHVTANPAGYHFEFREDDIADNPNLVYTQKSLVDFGNFLFKTHGLNREVSHADLCNWKVE